MEYSLGQTLPLSWTPQEEGVEYIYALRSQTDKKPRYIGRTNNPHNRAMNHAYKTGLGLSSWIKHTESPELVILDKCPATQAAECEIKWIKSMLSQGEQLFNRRF